MTAADRVPAPTEGTDPLVDALDAAIVRHRIRRVPLTVLRRAFAEYDPTGATSNDARARLAAAIDNLRETGTVVLPRSRRLYETHILPALPQWVERPTAPRPHHDPPMARVWRPELTNAAALATTPAEHDVLVAVDEFLRSAGTSRPLVPHRERSVELFGNEKRLDALQRTRLFTSKALTLEMLRCYRAPLPLTAQHTGDPGPEPHLLIVENHATYASVLRLARQRAAAGQPALAIGFGSGNQLPKAIEGVIQLNPEPRHLWYFGDLDEDGLAIANSAATAAHHAELPPLRPAVPLYRALLSAGARQPGNRAVDLDASRRLTGWLQNTELGAAADEVLTAGLRVAQESVGYETLAGLTSWT